MTEDDGLSSEERQTYITRYGEYRRVPVVRYGPFRLDREWIRHFTLGERELPWRDLVFEIDASSEFDMLGTGSELYKMSGVHSSDALIPTRPQVRHLVTSWLGIFRPRSGGGTSAVACYRRRVGLVADGQEAILGTWFIPPLFRRPTNPMIDMHEATPLVEAALHKLAQAETEAQEHRQRQES